jgi:ABC-type glycerol-3-phosphate transport system substrate-binding protein
MRLKINRRVFLGTGIAAGSGLASRSIPGVTTARKDTVQIKFVPNWGLDRFARKLATEFMEENPRIQIQISDRVKFDKPDYDRELLRAHKVGDPYDMVITGPYYSMWATQNGYTVDPAPLFRRDFGAGYASQFKDVFVWWKGRLVGIPFKSGTELFYYNRNLVEAAGLRVPYDGWGWNEFIAMAPQIANCAGAGEPQPWGCSVFEPELFRLYVAQAGMHLFSSDYRKATIDTSVSLEAAELVHDLIYRYKAMGSPDRWPRSGDEVATSWNHSGFYQGRVGLFLDGDLRVKKAYEEAERKGFRVGVAPPLKGKLRAVGASPTVFQIWKSPNPDRAEAAWEFAKLWLTPRNQARLLVETGNSPLLHAAYEEPTARKFVDECPGVAVFRDAYQYANRTAGIGTYPTMALEYLGIRPSIYKLSLDRIRPAEAVKRMQVKCQAILDCFWKKADKNVFELFPEELHR